MANVFDAYYLWLGIPPEDQPPHHYRLLGIRLFDDNAEVIQNAADQRMAHLRSFQTGKHSALSQRLLNEVATARVCLLNPQKKAAYDASLRARLAAAAPPEDQPESAVDPNLASLFEQASSAPSLAARTARPPRRSPVRSWIITGLTASVMLLMAGVVAWLLQSSPPDAPPTGETTSRANLSGKPPVAVAPPKTPSRLIFTWPLDQRRNARLEIDGKSQNIPAIEMSKSESFEVVVEPGSHAVSIACDGFKPFARQVAVGGNEAFPVEVTLEPAPADAGTSADSKGTADHSPPVDLDKREAGKSDNVATPEPEPKPSPAKAERPPVAAANAGPAKLPIPDDSAQAEARAALREKYKKEYNSKQGPARLALAAHLILLGRDLSAKPIEQYAVFSEAGELAMRQGDCLLAFLAVDELAKRFEINASKKKAAVLGIATRRARTPAAEALMIESAVTEAEQSLAAGQFEAWPAALHQLEAAIPKKSPLIQALRERESRLNGLSELHAARDAAAKKLEAELNDTAANFELGRYYCLVKKDWDAGLPLLAKNGKGPLSTAAARVVSQPSETDAQVALANAWWELADAERDGPLGVLMQQAAAHWYEQAMPRLAGNDLDKVEQRLLDGTSPREPNRQPFAVPLHGLAGSAFMLPAKFSGNVAAKEFATIGGKASLEYGRIGSASYVHEFELTFTAPKGTLDFYYGDSREGAKMAFFWNAENGSFRCQPQTYRGNWWFWGGSRDYKPGQRQRFTLYVNANQQMLYDEGAHIANSGAHATDLQFRIHASDDLKAVISRCEFRPWLAADAQRSGCSMPPSRIAGDWRETALRLHARNFGLSDHPAMAAPAPFVIPSTGTAMQWIAPGSFDRLGGKDRKDTTTVNITRGFWIARYEMTQGEWTALASNNPSEVVGSPFLPVDSVSWEDTGKYCAMLTQQESRAKRIPPQYVYRLPTEAEWEYACRAGSTDEFSVEAGGFWCAANGRRPHEVGEGSANKNGLYDMHGNVPEWCLDAWRDEPETPVRRVTDPFVRPKDNNELFVVRGGGWWNGPPGCSSYSREACKSLPGGYRGFRIVLGPALP